MKHMQSRYTGSSTHYNEFEYEDTLYRSQRHIVWAITVPIAIIAIILFALFAPLIFSILENHLFGSDHVYQTFQALDLADPLGKLYMPILETFPALNPP